MAEKVRCVNPVRIAKSVDTYLLAPRLDTIDGKNDKIRVSLFAKKEKPPGFSGGLRQIQFS